jgi:hypothetical protein
MRSDFLSSIKESGCILGSWFRAPGVPPIVVIYHVSQLSKASVVHEACSQGDVPQCRCLERTVIISLMRNTHPPMIAINASNKPDSVGMEASVRERSGKAVHQMTR